MLTKFFFVYLSFLLFGILLSFFGYKIFKIAIALLGFLMGFIISYKIGYMIFQTEIAGIITGLIVGIIIALLILFLYFFSIIIARFIFGFFIAYNILPKMDGMLLIIFYLVFMISGGIFAFYLQKGIIAISSAFIGAYFIVISIIMMLGISTPQNIKELLDINTNLQLKIKIIIVCMTLLFGILTTFYQLKMSKN